MALTLKKYQKNALEALTGFFLACRSVTPADAFRAALAAQNRANEAHYEEVFDGAPSACLRIPTGGGKTLLAAHAIDIAAKALMNTDAPVALWLTPSDVIRSQTLQALNTAGHPYRQALEEHYPQRHRPIGRGQSSQKRHQGRTSSCHQICRCCGKIYTISRSELEKF